MACGKDDDLEVLGSFLEALHDVGSDVDSCIHGLFIRKVNLQHDIRVLCFNIVNAVNERLVHVEDH